jgi:hypothetical protein
MIKQIMNVTDDRSIIKIENLTYNYLSMNDVDHFQTYISSKREFQELSYSRGPEPPLKNRGDLFRHQEFVKRYMLNYDKLILSHRTGSGKSCATFASSEQFKLGILQGMSEFVEMYIKPQRTNIKRIYFLTKGPTLVNEARKQLVCNCTSGEYITKDVLESTSDKILRSRVKREVAKYYSLETYHSFASSTLEASDEDIIKEYSDCFFCVDEIHNLKIESDEEIQGASDDTESIKVDEKKFAYKALFRVFHLVKNAKIMLMSATLMVDKPEEIESIVNLLLPLDSQMKISNYDTVTFEQIHKYTKGLFSFVRELETDAIPEYQGTTLEMPNSELDRPPQMKVWPSEMSKHQYEGYLRAESKTSTKFYSKERQASNIVFPDGSSDSAGFDRYITRLGPDRYIVRDKREINKNNFRELTCKGYEVIEECLSSQGNRFVYSNFVEMGILILCVGMNVFGFEQFLGTGNVFTRKGGRRAALQYCPGQISDLTREILIDKKLRFAIISTETTDVQAEKIQELFNSYENRHGEYIRVLLGSPKTQVGINLANVISIHLFDPHWNFSINYQALSRGIRATSHKILLAEAKGEKIMVKIYQHCAIGAYVDSEPTIEMKLYDKCEVKDIKIKRIERFIKKSSVDCQIHYARNVRKTDIDDTPICDYQKCNYKCADPSPKDIESTAYDVLYVNKEIDSIIDEIKLLFLKNFSMPISFLYQYFSNMYQRKYIELAIEKLYDQKIPVINRFGFENYIDTYGDLLILTSNFPLLSNVVERTDYYGNNLFVINNNNLESYSLIQSEILIQARLEYFQNNDFEDIELSDFLKSINIEERIIIVENCIYQEEVEKSKSKFNKKVIAFFYDNLFKINEPTKAILQIQEIFSIQKGKKRKEIKIAKNDTILQDLDYSELSNDKVIIHNILSNKIDRASYNVTTNVTKSDVQIRIFKISEETGFRDCNPYENIVYNYLIKLENDKNRNPILNEPVYGSISKADLGFRVHINDLNKAESKNKSRGRKCNTLGIDVLLEIMWSMKIKNPDVDSRRIQASINNMKSFLIEKKILPKIVETYSDDKIKYFTKWILSVSKTEICEYLHSELEKRNLIVEL